MSSDQAWLRPETLGRPMPTSVLTILDAEESDVTVMLQSGAARALRLEHLKVIEFEIAERAALGFAMGITRNAGDVLIHVGTLNFALHALDLLTIAPRSEGDGSLLVYGAVGSGMNLGSQHEWWSLPFLASLQCDRVIVPYAMQQLPSLLKAWRRSGERWLVALPVQVAMDGEPWSDQEVFGLARRPSASASFNVVCLGADTRAVCASFFGRPEVNILPIVDLKAPLRGVEQGVEALETFIVSGARTAPDAHRWLASYFQNSSPADDVATAICGTIV